MVRIADLLKKAEESKGKGSQAGLQSTPKVSHPLKEEEGPFKGPERVPLTTPSKPSGKGFHFSSLGKGVGAEMPRFETAPPEVPSTMGPSTIAPSTTAPFPPRSPMQSPSEAVEPARYVAQAIKGSEASRQQTAQDVYSRALVLAKTILDKTQTGEEITGKEIQQVIEDIIRELTYQNQELLTLACNQVVEEGGTDFIAADMVNKTVLAVDMGIEKKMNKSKLFQLGMAAFFSEIGITQMLDVATKKETLTEEDRARIRDLPNKTVEILKKIPDLNQVVLTVAKESKERGDASGPLGIKDLQQLDEFSRLVAVIDVFESLVHDRPHRKRIMPHEAMKLILEEGGKFESEVLRCLVDRLGIYPVGSWVKLTSKEIAKVIGSNPGQPLRPRVKVLFDERGTALEEPQPVDLSKNLSIQVLQPISDDELKKVVKAEA